MTALKIILLILFLIFLLLMTVVKVRVISDGSITLKVGAGPVMVGILPKKQKKIKLRRFTQKKYMKLINATPKKKKKVSEGAKSEKQEKSSFSDTKDLILELVTRAGRFTKKLRARVDSLKVSVGGKDAASAAITYGIVSQGAAYLIEVLDCRTKLRIPDPERISVKCDFTLEKTAFEIDVTLGVRIFDVLHLAVELLVVKIKHDMKAQKNTENNPSKTRKEEDKNGREQAERNNQSIS